MRGLIICFLTLLFSTAVPPLIAGETGWSSASRKLPLVPDTTWRQIGLDNYNLRCIASHPHNPDVLFAAAHINQGGKLFWSLDGGNSWDFLRMFPDVRIADVEFDRTGRLFVLFPGSEFGDGWRNNLWRSTDFGNTWENLGPLAPDSLGTLIFVSMTISGENPNILFLSGRTMDPNLGYAVIFKSGDGGTSWTQSYWGPESFRVDAVAIAQNTNQQILYGILNQVSTGLNYPYAILKSTNGGASWDTLASPFWTKIYGRDIKVSSQNPDLVYAGFGMWNSNYGLFRSTDGAATWTPIYWRPIAKIFLHPQHPEWLFASSSEYYVQFISSFYISEDGGNHVHDFSQGMEHRKVPDFVVQRGYGILRLFAATNDGVYTNSWITPGSAWLETLDTMITANTPAGPDSVIGIVHLKNAGKADLQVQVASDISWIWPEPSHFTLPRGHSLPLQVKAVVPEIADTLHTFLRLTSNAINRPQLSIHLIIPPPVAGIASTTEHIMRFALYPNFPNPFNPATTIRYALPRAEKVKLEIFNILGQRVKTLVNGREQAGVHRVKWDGTNNAGVPVASGVYLFRLEAGHFVLVRKMLLVR